MPPQNFPSYPIVVKIEKADQPLNMVVDVGMVKFGVDVFESLRRDAVLRQEIEIDSCGTTESRRVNAKST